jgi:hypothetical protein
VVTPDKLREAYLFTVINVEVEPRRWIRIDEAERSFPTPLDVVRAKRHGSHLRPDLFENHPPLRNRLRALDYETWLAESLRNKGFPVKGGH